MKHCASNCIQLLPGGCFLLSSASGGFSQRTSKNASAPVRRKAHNVEKSYNNQTSGNSEFLAAPRSSSIGKTGVLV
jgi:hypothetical protein